MFRHLSPSPLLTACLFITGLFVILNPLPNLDIVALGTAVFVIAYSLLKEKILLLFLVTRPALDVWRDTAILAGQNGNALMAIIFFTWSLSMLIKHRAKLPGTPLLGIFILTGGWFLYSATHSLEPLITLIETLKFLNIGLIFILSYVFVKHKIINPSELVLAVGLGALIPILTGIVQIIFQTGITTFEIKDRIFGTFAHPNVFAFFIIFLLFLHHHYSTMAPTLFWEKYHVWRGPVFVILIILLLLTYTRAAWVGLAIYAAIMAVLSYRRPSLRILYVLAGVYLILFPINDWLARNTALRLNENPLIARLTSRSEEADSVDWRLGLVRANLNLIVHGPRTLEGFGYGTFPTVWEHNRPEANQTDDSAESHNDYLRLAVEVGVVGLALYGLLLARLTWIAGRLVLTPPSSYKTIETNKQKSRLRPVRERDLHLFLFGSIIVFGAVSLSDNMLNHTPVMWMIWSIWGTILAEAPWETSGPNFLDK